jgi:hypothetical protein
MAPDLEVEPEAAAAEPEAEPDLAAEPEAEPDLAEPEAEEPPVVDAPEAPEAEASLEASEAIPLLTVE